MIDVIVLIVILASIVYPVVLQKIDFREHNILEVISILFGMLLPLSLLVLIGIAVYFN